MQEIFSESIIFVRRRFYTTNQSNDNDNDFISNQVNNISQSIVFTIWPRPIGLLQLIPVT